MGFIMWILKLFGLGEKFKFENILKSILVGGKQPAASGAGGGGGLGGLSLDKLKDMFASKGMGDIFASWVSKEKNKPVSGQQIKGLLSQEEVNTLAAQTNLPPDQVCDKLAKYLPGVVDKLTPEGKLPSEA